MKIELCNKKRFSKSLVGVALAAALALPLKHARACGMFKPEMILDKECLLSDAQAFTSDAATTNTYDCGNVTPKRDIGRGEPLSMVITVDVAADATTGDETYEFQFIQSANADLSSPDILAARTISRTDLTAGSIHVVPVPPGAITKRYVGGYFNGGGTTPTITATIFLQPSNMVQGTKDYAKGYTIS